MPSCVPGCTKTGKGKEGCKAHRTGRTHDAEKRRRHAPRQQQPAAALCLPCCAPPGSPAPRRAAQCPCGHRRSRGPAGWRAKTPAHHLVGRPTQRSMPCRRHSLHDQLAHARLAAVAALGVQVQLVRDKVRAQQRQEPGACEEWLVRWAPAGVPGPGLDPASACPFPRAGWSSVQAAAQAAASAHRASSRFLASLIRCCSLCSCPGWLHARERRRGGGWRGRRRARGEESRTRTDPAPQLCAARLSSLVWWLLT